MKRCFVLFLVLMFATMLYAGQELTDFTELSEVPASGDLVGVVDISDTTDSAEGTTKKVSYSNLVGGGDTVNVMSYGAYGTGATTTVSSWTNSTTVVVADASGFSVGDNISIERAALEQGTCDTDGTVAITDLTAGISFADGDAVWIKNGVQAERQWRELIVQVYGTPGVDKFFAKLNGTLSEAAVGAGDDSAIDVAETLCDDINNDHGGVGLIACNDSTNYANCAVQADADK